MTRKHQPPEPGPQRLSRRRLLAVIGWAGAGLLSGCAAGSGAAVQPPATPSPGATATGAPPPRPSPTPSPTIPPIPPTPTPRPAPRYGVYDDFGSSLFDNPSVPRASRWQGLNMPVPLPPAETLNEFAFVSGGILTFNALGPRRELSLLDPPPIEVDGLPRPGLLFSSFLSFQARLQLASVRGVDNYSYALRLTSVLGNVDVRQGGPEAQPWEALVGLRSRSGRAEFFYQVTDPFVDPRPETTMSAPARFDRWFTMRIDVDPQSMDLTFWADEGLFGRHQPVRANLMRLSYVARSLIFFTDSGLPLARPAQGLVDDVLATGYQVRATE